MLALSDTKEIFGIGQTIYDLLWKKPKELQEKSEALLLLLKQEIEFNRDLLRPFVQGANPLGDLIPEVAKHLRTQAMEQAAMVNAIAAKALAELSELQSIVVVEDEEDKEAVGGQTKKSEPQKDLVRNHLIKTARRIQVLMALSEIKSNAKESAVPHVLWMARARNIDKWLKELSKLIYSAKK